MEHKTITNEGLLFALKITECNPQCTKDKHYWICEGLGMPQQHALLLQEAQRRGLLEGKK